MSKKRKIPMMVRRKILYACCTIFAITVIVAICAKAGKTGIADITADPVIVVEAETNNRYSNLKITDWEINEMASIIYLEARGESEEGQQAVAEVILNRVASPQFPNTVHDVLYQKGQFSTIKSIQNAAPTEAQYRAICAALYGEPILPIDVVFFATRAENKNIWGRIGNHVFCYAYKW